MDKITKKTKPSKNSTYNIKKERPLFLMPPPMFYNGKEIKQQITYIEQ